MKHVVVAAIALVVGLVLGGMLPRAEVRALQGEVAALEDRPCQQRGMGRELAGLFRGEPPLIDELPKGDEAPRAGGSGGSSADGAVTLEIGGTERDPDRGADEPLSTEDLDQGLAALQEGLELRRVQARAALIEDARPSDEQLGAFDEAMVAMNGDLQVLAEEFVAQYEQGSVPTRRDMMSYAADTLDVMIEAEDQITSVFDEEQLQSAEEEAFDPFSHVDPAVVDVLYGLDLP